MKATTLVNVIFLVLIPAWLLAKAASLGFETGFSWAPQPETFVSVEFTVANMVMLFVSSAVLVFIGITLLARHLKNRKDTPYFLGMFNVILGAGLGYDGIRKVMAFTDEVFRNAIEALTFMFLAWSIVFFFLFLQDILTGSTSFQEHKQVQLAFTVLVACSVFFFMGWPAMLPVVASTFVAYGFLIAIIIPLGWWQIRSGWKLVKKTSEPRARLGLSMITFSAVFYLAIIATIAFKKLFFPLDLLLSILLLALSVATYMGYVYPSRGK